MRTPLPSKDMVLSACAGTIILAHPILHAAAQLASLHKARDRSDAGALDRERVRLVSLIDEWVAAEKPPAFGAAYLHSETVGMIIDRLAQLSVDAREAAQGTISVSRLRHARHRLTELANAYSDLAFEIARGTRRLPEFSHRPLPNPASQ
ncbi:Protein of unknown function (DUF4254) [Nocardia amikacinitolerans]|nr:Protein of unknown function (DUF4254) [Nocardia amikacinitolerans]